MSDDLIKRSDAIKAYNEAMDELVKWQMEEWQLGDFSECEFNTTDCKHIVRKIEALPSADRPQLDKDIVEPIGNGNVIMSEDTYEDLLDRPQEWIPCSERLPETKDIDDWVKTLVCSSDGSIAVGSFNSKYGWTFSHWFGEPIAWMPLPEPWKGADNEKKCHKPESQYYRAYCEEKEDGMYCEGCEFWH